MTGMSDLDALLAEKLAQRQAVLDQRARPYLKRGLCPTCKGRGHYASRGRGAGGWQWQSCEHCNSTGRREQP